MRNVIFLFAMVFYFLFSGELKSQYNINVSNYLLYEGEQYIAVNPVNPNNIIIAYMSLKVTGKIDIAVVYSNNGGLSFSAPSFLSHIYPSFTSADPCIAFRKTGEAYLSYVDYIPNSTDSGFVAIRKSTDGGASWGNPVLARSVNETSDLAIDRPWIYIDNTNGIYDGYMYLSTIPPKWAPLPNQYLHLKFSSNNGTNWSSDIQVSAPGYPGFHGSMGMMASGDNTLYIAYISLNGITPSYAFAKTTNNGISFTRSHITNWLTSGDSLIQVSYKLSANPLNGNELNFAFVNQFYNDPDIFSVKTVNGGVNWSLPLRVNDDSLNNGKVQDMCWADWNGNTFGIGWRDKRHYNIGVWSPYDIYYAVSTNGGVSFTGNYKMNLTSSGWNEYGVSGNDFLGFALHAGKVHMSWSALITGINWDIFYGRDLLTSVRSVGTGVPVSFALEQNYPNPFNSATNVKFQVPSLNFIKLVVFDLLGREVKTLVNEELQPGNYEVRFDAGDLPSGVYFYKLHSGDFTEFKKMILTK